MNPADANEIAQRTPREKTRGMRAISALVVSFNQRTEAGFLALFEFCARQIRVGHFPFATQNVGEAAGHARTKMSPTDRESPQFRRQYSQPCWPTPSTTADGTAVRTANRSPT